MVPGIRLIGFFAGLALAASAADVQKAHEKFFYKDCRDQPSSKRKYAQIITTFVTP